MPSLNFCLDENEKLKSGFSTEKTTWVEDKIALTQRAENAESSLKEVTAELSSLKHHISQMTSAIFAK